MPFDIARLILQANVVTPVTPPRPCYRVKVGNATADDLKVLSQTADVAQYSVIAAGFEDQFEHTGHYYFPATSPAFYLLSAVGGAVVLKWL